jgi:hypothetical protein
MICVAMPTVRIVGDDNLRPMTSNDRNQLLANDLGWGFSKTLIAISKEVDIADAEVTGRFAQLRLAQGRQLFLGTEGWIATRASLAARCGHQRDVRSRIGVSSRETGRNEAFVIWVSED